MEVTDDRNIRKRLYNSYNKYTEGFKEKLERSGEHSGIHKSEPSGMSVTKNTVSEKFTGWT